MTGKRFIYLTALAITLGISSTSNAEIHIGAGPEGYFDCWMTWMESGPKGKAGLECHEIAKFNNPDEKKDCVSAFFRNCKVMPSGGRSLSRTYLICETG